jgi:hypothetical protein
MPRIAAGLCTGLGLFGLFKLLRFPDLFFYGFVGGFGAIPHGTIPMMLGAFLGRYYFAKRFGLQTWTAYVPVFLAGYACGMGLIGMCSTAIRMIGMSISHLPF